MGSGKASGRYAWLAASLFGRSALVLLVVASLAEPAEAGPSRATPPVVQPSWMADPNSLNYSWPWVHSYCIPCKLKKVGTCFLSPCYDWRGESECQLTRCVCRQGFCADEDAYAGQERCVPQTCVAGPRPLPFKPNNAVELFHWLGGSRQFPHHATVDSAEMWEFFVSTAFSAVWLFVLGFFVVTATILGFVWYQPPKGKHHRREMALLQDGGDVSESSPNSPLGSCSEADTPVHRKPRMRTMVVLAIVTLTISFAGVFARLVNWRSTLDRVGSNLDHMNENAVTLDRLGRTVDATCIRLQDTLDALKVDCGHDALMVTLSNKTSDSVKDYMKMVHRLKVSLSKLPGAVQNLRDLTDKYQNVAFWIPLAPVMVVALASTLTVTEALLVTLIGKSRWAVRLDRLLSVMTFPAIALMLFVAAFGALGLILAIVSSDFCSDVDDNVLGMVYTATAEGNMTDVYNMTRFYLKGTGVQNPVMSYAKTALSEINNIYDVYLQFESTIKSYYVACPPLQNIMIEGTAKEARRVLSQCVGLLEPANLYPYYNSMIREAFCGDLIVSFASFPVFTVVLGLLVFPACAVATHRYLVNWAHWKLDQEILGGEEASEYENEDESDDDTDSDSSVKRSPL